MTIKTILLHAADDRGYPQRLETAAELARRFSAFVKAVYTGNRERLPPAAQSGALQSQAVIADSTRSMLADTSYSWTVTDGNPLDCLAAAAAYADLTVISQATGRGGADQLALYIPCPTLIVPHTLRDDLAAHRTPLIGRHALIAWRNTREAAAAVRGALPFLQRAERVTILTVDSRKHAEPAKNDHRAGGAAGDDGRELLIFLERHGIPSQHQARIDQPTSGRHGDVGPVILAHADELACDMIIMGTYGRSRLREVVFGGATRTLMREATVPILTAH